MPEIPLKVLETIASMKERNHVTIKKSRRILGTFTRERPSYFAADLFWIVALYIVSIIFAAGLLQKRKATFLIAIKGTDDSVDFSRVTAASLVKWMLARPQRTQGFIDAGIKRIQFLASLIDPLPEFIAKPTGTTTAFARMILLYCIYRFALQHRYWRFNRIPIITSVIVFLAMLWHTKTDAVMTLHISALWCWPTLVVASVALHRFLGKRAWKAKTVVMELTPKEGRFGYGYEKESYARDDGDEEEASLLKEWA